MNQEPLNNHGNSVRRKKVKLKLIIPSAILLAALILAAIYFYPIIRAKHDPNYVPWQARNALKAETKITEDMYIPVEMIQAVFALPEDKRIGSPELQAVTKMFEERVEVHRKKSFRFIGTRLNELSFVPERIEEETEDHQAMIVYTCGTKRSTLLDHESVVTRYKFAMDGSLTIESQWHFYGIRYFMENINGEKNNFFKWGKTNNRIEINW